MQLVLDTNVVLDWLVFRDPGVAHIAAALGAGRVGAWTNAACEEELMRVLRYPQFGLTPDAQQAALAEYRRTVRRFGGAVGAHALPRCIDPDDQKFLELTRDASATHLVTKDKSLLTLARARYRMHFAIVRPADLAVPD